MKYKIAIDGPAGSGKSSVSKILSKNNDLLFLTSGVFYRACAFLLKDINKSNTSEIKRKLDSSSITYDNGDIFINNKKIKEELFTMENTNLASIYSTIIIVRKFVNKILRDISKNKSVIMDGRDVGTVIFPDADIKIFLTANILNRVKRRKLELDSNNQHFSTLVLIKEIFLRDWRDKHRSNDPLKKSKKAIVISTNNKNISEVVVEIQFHIDRLIICKK